MQLCSAFWRERSLHLVPDAPVPLLICLLPVEVDCLDCQRLVKACGSKRQCNVSLVTLQNFGVSVSVSRSVYILHVPGRAAWLLMLTRCTGRALQDSPLKTGSWPTTACIALRHARSRVPHFAVLSQRELQLPGGFRFAAALQPWSRHTTSLRDPHENPLECRKEVTDALQTRLIWRHVAPGATMPLRQF
jgi:hypothetical protein